MNLCPHCSRPLEEVGIAVNVDEGLLIVDDQSYPVTPRSRCEMMAIFVKRINRVVSRESIYTLMFDHRSECDQPEIKIIDVYVSQIRKAL